MSAELLARLRALDVKIFADGDRLRCSAPKGMLTPELQQQLSGQKAVLLALLREEGRAAPADALGAPLTFAQERLWFLDQLVPGLSAYNITGAVRLGGNLNIAALEQAITEIVRRQGALRTSFSLVDDLPVQVVHAPGPVTIPLVDLSSLPAEARERRMAELSAEHSRRTFDLAQGPLYRIGLLRLAADQHALLFSIHHIVADGWSMGVFIGELAALYSAFIAGRASPLPELPTQYIDYARWQRQHIQGEVLERQLAYWLRQLGGERAIMDLPTDRPRPPEQTFVGAHELFNVPKPLVDRLHGLARREKATLFMVLLSVFQTLLHRYTGLTDILVGTPIANRTRLESERLIGLFANSLVLRTDFSGAPTFREVLRRVRGMALDAYAHQDVPFARLVELLKPPRDPSRTPLFDVTFALQNVPAEQLTLPGLTLTPVLGNRGGAKSDITLEMGEHPMGLAASLEYSSLMFDPESIRRLWRHFHALLEAVVEDPDRSIGELPLLSAEEERQLVIEWNDTGLEHDHGRCVHHLLEATARRTPAAPAVTGDGVTLDFRTLDQRANRLARALQRRGVGRGALVGICLDRTVDMPVALAAVLKAGAAYVPLDPAHPPDRLNYTLADAGVVCAVTHARFVPLLSGAGVPLLVLDEAEPELSAQSEDTLNVAVRPEDLAYVIYTSGSTGRPKGVEVEHRNVVSLLEAVGRQPGLAADDVVLAVTTLAFDVAGVEMWLPLAVGARLVISSRREVLDPERLMGLMVTHGVTVMQATPATWRLLIDGGWTGRPGLRVLCAGEALSRELAGGLTARVGELWNMYGPTETTIYSTGCRIDDGEQTITIGRPIANTRAYVLDGMGRPTPIGVAGELHIGGEGVARGYRNLPELTAERFLTIDLPGRPAERVYRTGDVARWRPDGTIEYLGRRDNQVKIRGYRIELGEIEAVLRTHPGVADCAVVAREETPGDQRLVAYLSMLDGRRLDLDAVRSTLRARLPEYMLPGAFEILPELPLTPSGKVDRKALPTPSLAQEPEHQASQILLTPAQQRVMSIWERLLGRGRIGLHENFFDIGGHSLLLVRLQSALKRDFRAEVTLMELFQHTTVAAQAERLESFSVGDVAVAAGR